ncbi:MULTISPECIES: hypothetical protein [Micromonospora]|uniref:Uncharacterized protein n=1 Tax=Micromonospora solifontis TaxID=2487138 RepID=A0ABX9WL30_9ACTN|nr:MULTISPECIES: hypothetical protein [Micromonospora]NES13683.1 hypothetical protein [Micromonospora sp. PPF5-17B]NES35492.1 hypothetical protein [Micromonospora solifontis]NES55351.1 hypothetical protein [Micromonospora sp. PPF5-6]RNM00741.1 hypothetical protein EFE23_04855 [Micromonospora solifontis]
MSLTGIPLLALATAATIAAACATAYGWHRTPRARLLLRPTAVLLTELLVLLTVGLAVNRHEQFYTSWHDLLDTGATATTGHDDRPGQLDRWLAHQATGPDTPITFDWRPTGWQNWRLGTPPTVVVPAGYLRHPGWRYPAVLVVGDDDRWNPTEDQDAAHAASSAGPAVLVFTRPAATVDPGVLAGTVPLSLTRDLRVTSHTWALVATTRRQALANAIVHTAPDRYPALALVDDTTTRTAALAGLPAGEALAVTAPAAGPATGDPVRLAAGPDRGLPAALRWACQQTPAPLAAPAPLIPPPQRTRHPHHHPPAIPPSTAGAHVTRQRPH